MDNDLSDLDFVVRKWIIMSQFENDQQRYENLKNNAWICDVEDAPDNSGDAILTFPDELCILMGWKAGTVLDFEAVGSEIFVKEVK